MYFLTFACSKHACHVLHTPSTQVLCGVGYPASLCALDENRGGRGCPQHGRGSPQHGGGSTPHSRGGPQHGRGSPQHGTVVASMVGVVPSTNRKVFTGGLLHVRQAWVQRTGPHHPTLGEESEADKDKV